MISPVKILFAPLALRAYRDLIDRLISGKVRSHEFAKRFVELERAWEENDYQALIGLVGTPRSTCIDNNSKCASLGTEQFSRATVCVECDEILSSDGGRVLPCATCPRAPGFAGDA